MVLGIHEGAQARYGGLEAAEARASGPPKATSAFRHQRRVSRTRCRWCGQDACTLVAAYRTGRARHLRLLAAPPATDDNGTCRPRSDALTHPPKAAPDYRLPECLPGM